MYVVTGKLIQGLCHGSLLERAIIPGLSGSKVYLGLITVGTLEVGVERYIIFLTIRYDTISQ